MVGVAWQLGFTTWCPLIAFWQVSHGIVNRSWRQAFEVGIPIFISDSGLVCHSDRYAGYRLLFLVQNLNG